MRLAAESWNSEWKSLIAIILSARTRDEKTIEVCEKLFKKYSNVKSLSVANLSDVEKIIMPVNFYRNKARNIIKCSKMIVNNFNGKVPRDINQLLKLAGVGRKTANVFLSEYGKEAIGVDTHVAYISGRLKWTKHKDAHKIEKDLEKLFPRNKWSEINHNLVRFGKTYRSRKKKDEILDEIKKLK